VARKTKYYYDPLSMAFKKIERTWKHWVRDVSLFALTSSLVGIFLFFLVSTLFDSPREKQLQRELDETGLQMEALEERLDAMDDALSDMETRDNEVYRLVFETDPLPHELRRNIGNTDRRYAQIRGMSNGALLERVDRKAEELGKRLYIQSKSLDEVVALAKNKEQLLEAIPAIRPVPAKRNVRLASGYGYRVHPIYKVRKMHTGIDFTAKSGTPIYASGNGTVVHPGDLGGSGYGIQIVISHGYGYHTLYAHLSRAVARPGQRVKRGDLIGYVGSTGRSTAPHLHYEVIKNGRKINPINFFFNDLTAAEYAALVEEANRTNQSFD
jgi:murein DD-endopeptidase MepM/ murein hydrolase activator NlpD